MQPNTLKPYLADVFAFTIHTPDLVVSSQFYQKLGFREILRGDHPFPFIQLSDDAILIMLRKSEDRFLALTYYVKNIEQTMSTLQAKGVPFASPPQQGDAVKSCLLKSPDKAIISLLEMPDVFTRPSGRTMIDMDQAEYFQPATYTNQVAGMYGEYAETVADLGTSIAFWEKLGFATLMRFEPPKPWAILSDGLSIIGLHESTEFDEATITFFAADMASKLEQLKEQGLSFHELGGGNAILATPEGQKLFLFSMGE